MYSAEEDTLPHRSHLPLAEGLEIFHIVFTTITVWEKMVCRTTGWLVYCCLTAFSAKNRLYRAIEV